MENYHRHTHRSNIMTSDSIVKYEDYAKRAVELGQKTLCSVEHGWQGYYYECWEIAKEHKLKFIFGTEAYWVKDRFEKDRKNCHIVILAKNEEGRREINRVLSEANESGYYYRPRLDLELIKQLTPKNVMVTTACVGFWLYDDIEDIVLDLYNHFNDSFYLEIQYHNTEKQIELNEKILKIHNQYKIPLILGMDSHYIYEEQASDRDAFLKSRGLFYEEEDGWYVR